MTTEMTPGRAAYEAGGLGPNDMPWSALTARDRAVWDEAARAAVAAYIEANGRDPVDARSIVAEAVALPRPSVTGYGPAADALRLEHERDEARAVVREMAAHIMSGDDYADPAKLAAWRERSGIAS